MSIVSKSFTAVGNSDFLLGRAGQTLSYSISGTFVGTALIQRTLDGGQTYETLVTATAADSGTLVVGDLNQNALYRIRCSAYTSGTIVTSIQDAQDVVEGADIIDGEGTKLLEVKDGSITKLVRKLQKKIITAGAKVGGTAGWVVDAANDKGSLAKLPASQTASTLVVKIPDLKVGDVITAFSVNGQLESGGNTATLDAALRAQTAAAGDLTDASLGAITQVSETADAIINASKTLATEETVVEGKAYYILLTGTTAAATDIDLLNVTITVTEN